MTSWLTAPHVSQLLDTLYADAAVSDPLARQAVAPGVSGAGFYHGMKKAYMAIGPEFGKLLYTLARTTKAKTIVEFGTSFGISTIYLASALRDNGGGTVITTEFEPEKAAQAERNISAAGLREYVDFRVGDARESLARDLPEVDMVFLDGAKDLYFDVLKTVEPRLRSGSIVASDNTDHEGMENFLTYIREARNGYTSAAILTGDSATSKGHEISLRL